MALFSHVTVYSNPCKNKSVYTNRLWLGLKCIQLRTKYHKAKSLYAKNKSTDNKMRLNNVLKSYKKCMFKYLSQPKFNTENMMKQFRINDSKEFYKLFKVKRLLKLLLVLLLLLQLPLKDVAPW